ncbi:MAG TPA: amino acid adenylation domain-containing protein, partial [Longimicrobiaceae bacterium]|nr:amino acid adenylation domain-containing protein [Longimicrobiaceae bacterium]
ATLGAYAHQELPFERLVEALQPERSLDRSPLFQVMLNMLNLDGGEIGLPGIAVERLPARAAEQAKFEITLYARETADGLRLELVYDAELFARPRMEELLEQLRHLLAQAAADPERPVSALSLATPAARALLPDPTAPLHAGWEGAVHEAFARHAARAPGRVAVVDPAGSWSYGELDAHAGRLSHRLRAGGVGRGDVVAVYAHRSAALVQALLGVLGAGAAFLVLDPRYPAPRLLRALRAAGPRALLRLEAAGDLPAALREWAADSGCLSLALPARPGEDAHPLPASVPAGSSAVETGPDDLAYVAFTSGSTGEPRGVLGTHRPLSHFLAWHRETFGLGEGDRFAMLSGLAHDPLLRDVFTPLWTGATLCIPGPDEMERPGGLAEWMRREAVTVVHLTPAMGELLGEDAELPSLRRVFFGGDVVRRRDLARIRAAAPRAECAVFYGATETPQAMGCFVPPAEEERVREVLPLGRGIADVQLLVLAPGGGMAGVGELGEICIRTPHLARGYLRDDAATAERFPTNPFTRAPGDRVYRTGDLGRYLPGGSVEFAGRADRQVKVRGFRVEPAEVEAALAQHPLAGAAAVAAWSGAGETRLVAYVVAADASRPPSTDELRAWMRERLPEYMVPSAFVALERLPLTPNGKLDLPALPAPEWVAEEGAFMPPRTPAEEVLAAIWTEVLRAERVGVHDDFFALGGHSLLGTQVVSRVREAFGAELPLRALFEAPTLAALARRVEGLAPGAGDAAPLLPAARGGALPLSFAQQRLWFLEQLDPGNPAYHLPAALRISGRLDTAVLERALGEVVRRHEALRTVFRRGESGPVQVVLPAAGVPLPVADLAGVESPEAEARSVAEEEAARPFDLERGPVFRARLLRLAAEDHVLVLTLHHVAGDGWSVGIFSRELSALYG